MTTGVSGRCEETSHSAVLPRCSRLSCSVPRGPMATSVASLQESNISLGSAHATRCSSPTTSSGTNSRRGSGGSQGRSADGSAAPGGPGWFGCAVTTEMRHPGHRWLLTHSQTTSAAADPSSPKTSCGTSTPMITPSTAAASVWRRAVGNARRWSPSLAADVGNVSPGTACASEPKVLRHPPVNASAEARALRLYRDCRPRRAVRRTLSSVRLRSRTFASRRFAGQPMLDGSGWGGSGSGEGSSRVPTADPGGGHGAQAGRTDRRRGAAGGRGPGAAHRRRRRPAGSA